MPSRPGSSMVVCASAAYVRGRYSSRAWRWQRVAAPGLPVPQTLTFVIAVHRHDGGIAAAGHRSHCRSGPPCPASQDMALWPSCGGSLCQKRRCRILSSRGGAGRAPRHSRCKSLGPSKTCAPPTEGSESQGRPCHCWLRSLEEVCGIAACCAFASDFNSWAFGSLGLEALRRTPSQLGTRLCRRGRTGRGSSTGAACCSFCQVDALRPVPENRPTASHRSFSSFPDVRKISPRAEITTIMALALLGLNWMHLCLRVCRPPALLYSLDNRLRWSWLPRQPQHTRRGVEMPNARRRSLKAAVLSGTCQQLSFFQNSIRLGQLLSPPVNHDRDSRGPENPCRSEPGKGFPPFLWAIKCRGRQILGGSSLNWPTSRVSQVFDLLFREITPDDYETLLRLDESVSRLMRTRSPVQEAVLLLAGSCQAHCERILHQQSEERPVLRDHRILGAYLRLEGRR